MAQRCREEASLLRRGRQRAGGLEQLDLILRSKGRGLRFELFLCCSIKVRWRHRDTRVEELRSRWITVIDLLALAGLPDRSAHAGVGEYDRVGLKWGGYEGSWSPAPGRRRRHEKVFEGHSAGGILPLRHTGGVVVVDLSDARKSQVAWRRDDIGRARSLPSIRCSMR